MPITNSEFIRVIPFDPPEAVSVELVSRKQREYSAKETEELIPYLTCLTPEGVQALIVNGKKMCRKDENCNVKLDSVRTTIEMLDGLTKQILNPIGN